MKTGPLPTIAGNDANDAALYDIDDSTAIRTDPYITTQGVQDSGRIYRGSAAGDGAPTSYLLGASTPSNFDTQIGFDTQFDTGTQIGAFLFDSLAFTDSPAGITTTDGPTGLAFIAINSITANPATAATVDVSGLTQILLATRNGPITLNNITFTDSPGGVTPANGLTTDMTVYARGATSVLDVTADLDVNGNLSLYGEGGLNFNQGAQALNANSTTLVSGADMNIGGTLDALSPFTSSISASASGNLSVLTSGDVNSFGALTFTSGGTFGSDGYTSANFNTLTINSTGDLTTTGNASLIGGTVNLTTQGALSLGGHTQFTDGLTASSVNDMTIPGVVGGRTGLSTTQIPQGTAMFTTSNGYLAVSGQITSSTINLTATSGDYSTSSPALITGNTITISAPAGNISLSSGAYQSANLFAPGTVTVTGGNITVPESTFTPQTNLTFDLTQPGTFTVPSDSTYTFDGLTLNNPDTDPNPGNLVIDAGGTLFLNTATLGGSLSLADRAAFTVNNGTVAQTVTLTGSPTLNINGLFQGNNTDGASDAFTATGAAVINIGTTGSSANPPELLLPSGNFNGGSATIYGSYNSTLTLSDGDLTAGAVTIQNLNVNGSTQISGMLTVGNGNVEGVTTGSLSAGMLNGFFPVVNVSGDVTPYDRGGGDTFNVTVLTVGGSLNYGGINDGYLPDLNGGQLVLNLGSGFHLGAGVAGAGLDEDSYASSIGFAGAALVPTSDNLTAGNGGSLRINTSTQFGSGDFTVNDFTGNGDNTFLSFNGGNLVSATGNTGHGGNGGSFSVVGANDITLDANVVIHGYGGDFINDATVTGAGTPTGGNGGTFSLMATNSPTGAITIVNPSEFDLYGGAVGNGGATGTAGNGGSFSLSAAGNIEIESGTGANFTLVNVRGGGAQSSGISGNGGTISAVSSGGAVTVQTGAQLTADGGLLQGKSGTAGNGGTITLQSGGAVGVGGTSGGRGARLGPGKFSPGVSAAPTPSDITLITADGGTASLRGTTGGSGGSGGTVTISSGNSDITRSSITLDATLVSATTGDNSAVPSGGTGGTINLTATDDTPVPSATPAGSATPAPPAPAQIYLTDTAVVASDDGTVTTNTANSHSQVGGTINVTADRTGGPGIELANGTQLVALVNSASPGMGGKIDLLTSGASITVEGSSVQASGTGSQVRLNTQAAPASGSDPANITLNGATVSADKVALQTFGDTDGVTVTGGTTVTADTTLAIYSHLITVGAGSISTNQLLASTTGGTINLSALDGSYGTIDLNGATLAANTINLQATGAASAVFINGGSSVTAGTALTIHSATVGLGGDYATNELLANNTGGTITIDTMTPTTAGMIGVDIGTVMADTIAFTASGPGGEIDVSNGEYGNFVAQSSLSLTASKVLLTSSYLSADASTGVFTVDTSDPTQTGTITISGSTLSAGSFTLNAQGTGGTASITDDSTLTGSTSVSIMGSNIQLTGASSVTADANLGQITLDTKDPAQDGVVNIDTSTLSAANVSITAQGANGKITVGGTSSTQLAQISSTGTTGQGTELGALTLHVTGASGSIAINPDSMLTAAKGTLTLLADGASGSITVGAAPAPVIAGFAAEGPPRMPITSLSADLLKLRAFGTNGGIVINGGSTLSATTQLKLYADGSNGAITFQGGNITLNTGTLAGILAAPTITIKTGTTVTVNGSTPIEIFTNTANYSNDFGGNDSQTGNFAGTAQPTGAPIPFSSAPTYSRFTPSNKIVSKAIVPMPASVTTPVTNATKAGKLAGYGPAAPVKVATVRTVSIPFSALNPKDLSFDPGLLKGGPQTATLAKGSKVASRPSTGNHPAAAREKMNAGSDRAGRPSEKSVANLASGMVRTTR